MSGLKRGTIIVECDPHMKSRFYRILPFMEGLVINFEEDEDCIQIQYELDNQSIDNLVAVLNKQDKREFRLISHVDEFPQYGTKGYDLARDISNILNNDEDPEDGGRSEREAFGFNDQEKGNLGSIGSKPNQNQNSNDDKQKLAGNSNSKGLKSKSSSFYPPNDPRSFAQDPPGNRPSPQTQQQQPPSQKYTAPMYNQGSVPYRVEDFDQIFEDDDPYPIRPNPTAQGPNHHQMMMNQPHMQRGVNQNMNPNLNPGPKGMNQPNPSGGGLNNSGGGSIGSGQMYNQPPQGRYPKGAPQTAPMNPGNYTGQPTQGKAAREGPIGKAGHSPVHPGPHDHGYYGSGGNFDDPQAKAGKLGRAGQKGAPPPPRGYADYGAYQEDEGMANYNEYGPSSRTGHPNPGPGPQGYPPARGTPAAPQHYSQYPRDEYDPRQGYDPNMRPQAPYPGNPPPRGPIGPAYPGGRTAPPAQPGPQQRYPQQPQYAEDDYYEDGGIVYDDEYNNQVPQPAMGGPKGNEEFYEDYNEYGEYEEYGNQYPPQNPPQAPKPNDYSLYTNPIPAPSVLGSNSIPEPFTVEGSINAQMFDRKPGFDWSRKKVHTRERLKLSMQKNKVNEKSGKKVGKCDIGRWEREEEFRGKGCKPKRGAE